MGRDTCSSAITLECNNMVLYNIIIAMILNNIYMHDYSEYLSFSLECDILPSPTTHSFWVSCHASFCDWPTSAITAMCSHCHQQQWKFEKVMINVLRWVLTTFTNHQYLWSHNDSVNEEHEEIKKTPTRSMKWAFIAISLLLLLNYLTNWSCTAFHLLEHCSVVTPSPN